MRLKARRTSPSRVVRGASGSTTVDWALAISLAMPVANPVAKLDCDRLRDRVPPPYERTKPNRSPSTSCAATKKAPVSTMARRFSSHLAVASCSRAVTCTEGQSARRQHHARVRLSGRYHHHNDRAGHDQSDQRLLSRAPGRRELDGRATRRRAGFGDDARWTPKRRGTCAHTPKRCRPAPPPRSRPSQKRSSAFTSAGR